MRVVAPRPMIAVMSRLQSRDCSGEFRRMATNRYIGDFSLKIKYLAQMVLNPLAVNAFLLV